MTKLAALLLLLFIGSVLTLEALSFLDDVGPGGFGTNDSIKHWKPTPEHEDKDTFHQQRVKWKIYKEGRADGE